MLQITTEQASQRYSTLPPILQDAIFSNANADTVRFIASEQQLDDKQMYNLSIIAGDVIFGFLDINDTVKELKVSLDIDDSKARVIAEELNQRIFAALKEEIEKNYQPLKSEGFKISPPLFYQPPQPLTSPHIPVQKSFREFLIPQSTPRPATTPEPSKPVVNLQSFAVKDKEAKIEEGIKKIKKEAAPEPELTAPFILHQETPPQTNPVFQKSVRIEIKPALPAGTEQKKPAPIKPVPVKIESPPQGPANGTSGASGTQPPFNPTQNTPRVVHYNDFRTPLNNIGLPKKDAASLAPPPPEIQTRLPNVSEENIIDLRKK